MANSRKLIVEVVGDSSSLERSFLRSSRAAGAFNRDLGRAGRGIAAVTVGYRSLARSVAFASTAFVGAAGITAGLKASISGFSQFNDEMQKTVGLANVAQGSVAGFSKQILQLAPQVGKSPQELATAFLFAASSGLKAAQAMKVVGVAAKASASGLGETQVVADAVTSAMNAYGPSVLSAQKATDVLVATVREGKGEADQFAGVIGNVAALASQLGVSFDQVGAALAAQTRLGTDAETSATQLQRVFTTLLKVTPQSAKAFKSVGLNADDLRKTLADPNGLLKVLGEVQKAFKGNDPALAKAFGDTRSLRGVLSLVGKQADATRGIFDRLAKSSGSLKTAFDAVNKDTAQQFRKLKAAAEVTAISVGAVFAPLAGKVAGALADASGKLTDFFNRLGAAKTFDAKLNVVFTGLESAARSITAAMGRAVGKVDWKAVWAKANGIADGLQARLEQINWGKVGSAIGSGIAKGVAGASAATKQLASRLSDAIGSIDFVKLGRKMGPGLAAAVVEAFNALLDPSFWLKNWDLALSVAVTVFGGSIFKVAGKLGGDLVLAILRPVEKLSPRLAGALLTGLVDLGRVAGDAVLKVAGAIERVSPLLGRAFLSGFLRIGGLVAGALSPVERLVSREFGRLGRLARFTVKVLGIQAAIDAVVGFAGKVKSSMGDAFHFMERVALEAALKVVKALDFSILGHHVIPGVHGLVNRLQGELDRLTGGAQDTADAVNRALSHIGAFVAKDTGDAISRVLRNVAQDTSDAVSRVLANGPATTTTPSRTTPAPTTPTRPTTTPASIVEKGFTLPFRLQLAQAKAEATKTAADDLKVAAQIRAFILKAIPTLHGEKLLGAYQALAQANSQLADKVKKAADKVKGFTTPLALQVEQARAEALGNDGQLHRILEKIRASAQKALRSGKLGLQGQLDAWNTIASVNSQLQDAGKKAVSSFKKADLSKLTAGFNLSAADRKALEARLSQLGPGGTVPSRGVGAFGVVVGGGDIVVHTSINLDGKKVGQSVTRHQQKRNQRNPPQRRGPHAGLAF